MTAGRGPSGEDRSVDELAGEDSRLADSVSALSSLGSHTMPLRELLTRVAGYAVNAIPGADGAGLTLIEDDRADTIVATAAFVSDVDDVQYGLGDGPCIMAAREGRTVMSGSLEDEPRWGAFGGRVAALGVHSVVSLPLRLGVDVLGAMNVYARAHDAFDARAAELGEAFAAPAAVAVQHAQVVEQTRRLAEELLASLETRASIEQAVGVLMAREGIDVDEARAMLDVLAHERGAPLGVLARALLADAVRRGAEGNASDR
ncbi:GAF and ANTAR domain-containing protein [Microlunatus antarcticus]|uniref:GAF domain-containing protein n=1 Tax=Microlunatus antarcticus TaxID=53388 RepID=A0A7W5JUR9_9ACTN|nr:GAF and ANTAR domain-containing protein [Microlunatus antarcticus]MBB3326654.1 GAF domain-containing protein [Microlunatus antarcticus]